MDALINLLQAPENRFILWIIVVAFGLDAVICWWVARWRQVQLQQMLADASTTNVANSDGVVVRNNQGQIITGETHGDINQDVSVPAQTPSNPDSSRIASVIKTLQILAVLSAILSLALAVYIQFFAP